LIWKNINLFFKRTGQKFSEKLKKSKKLSNASDAVKQFFDREASEAKEYYSSSEEEDDVNIDDDNESEKSNSDEELPDLESPESEEDSTSTRKRKCEFSTFFETSPKKKDASILGWFPNGDKVSVPIL